MIVKEIENSNKLVRRFHVSEVKKGEVVLFDPSLPKNGEIHNDPVFAATGAVVVDRCLIGRASDGVHEVIVRYATRTFIRNGFTDDTVPVR